MNTQFSLNIQIYANEDLEKFCADERGGKQTPAFYDIYPDLEICARQFAVEAASRKDASFTVQELAEHIDDQYYLLRNEKKESDGLVRSVHSLRLDLRRWNIQYGANKLRPYFIGHERQDVVEHRKKLVDYFLTRQDLYYRVTKGENPQWITPSCPHPVVLLCKSICSGLQKQRTLQLIFLFRSRRKHLSIQ